MLTWITLTIALLILIVVVWRLWGNRPISYRGLKLVDTQRYLESFVLQLNVGSVFVVERESGPGFLQLALTDRRHNGQELEFGLPHAEWSREQFDLVHNAMEAAGHICRLEAEPGNMAIPRFLRVRIVGNREELTARAIQVLELAAGQLGFHPEDRYTLQMKGSFSSEYLGKLADQMEHLPRGGVIARPTRCWVATISKKGSARLGCSS